MDINKEEIIDSPVDISAVKKGIELMGLSTIMSEDWAIELYEEFNKPYMQELSSFLQQERKYSKNVYPPQDQVFTTFKELKLSDVQVVIVDKQLEYPDGVIQKIPENDEAIKNAIEESCYNGLNLNFPLDYKDLWLKQGIFYLNNVLTTDKYGKKSHCGKGWEIFTEKVITILNKQENKIFFLALGVEAKTMCKDIDTNKHIVLNVEHPCMKKYTESWNYQDCFNQISAFVKQEYKKDLKW